jgi:rhamnogalacturonan endolyase
LAFDISPPAIYSQTETHLDVVFQAKEGDLHWVLTPTLPGAYQYFVNKALPILGEFRTLWIMDNRTFTHGVTIERNERLPSLSDVKGGKKTGDETFQKADGSFITKYDFSAFLGNVEGDLTYWGLTGTVGGSTVGSWYIHGGKVWFRWRCRLHENSLHL